MLTRLSSKGQVVINKAVRDALGLKVGTCFHVQVSQGKIVLEPILASAVATLQGRFAGANLVGDLEAEHRQEIEHEAAPGS